MPPAPRRRPALACQPLLTSASTPARAAVYVLDFTAYKPGPPAAHLFSPPKHVKCPGYERGTQDAAARKQRSAQVTPAGWKHCNRAAIPLRAPEENPVPCLPSTDVFTCFRGSSRAGAEAPLGQAL